jgi:tRNA(fMet)-specific endonuclease VapC
MRFLFDTNIAIHYMRKSSVMVQIENKFSPFASGQEPFLCAVSIGELRSFAIQNNWGEIRKVQLEQFFKKFIITDINVNQILHRYAEIDAFSQNKLIEKPLTVTARNMGKNDLWIAATASVLNAKLLTTDADFVHLDDIFVDLEQFLV